MLRQSILLRSVIVATVAAASLSLQPMSIAQAEQKNIHHAWAKPDHKCRYLDLFQHRCLASNVGDRTQPCRIYDPSARRCLAFMSDSAYPEGLPDYFGDNDGGISADVQ